MQNHYVIRRIKMAAKNKWSRVSILTALLNEVDTLITNNPQLGYPSTSSFVNDAVRRLLEKSKERTNENTSNRKPTRYNNTKRTTTKS